MEAQAQLQREERISKVLEPGENILWRGQPDRRIFVVYPAIRMSVGSLGMVYLVFIRPADIVSGHFVPDAITFAYLMLILILLGILGSISALRRRWCATEYLVTDKRLLSMDPAWPGGKLSFPLEDVTSSRLAFVRKDGLGGLVFKSRYYNGRLEFSGINESQAVLEVARQAQKERLAALGQGT